MKKILIVLLTMCYVSTIQAQTLSNLWTGLRDTQEIMPKGNAPFQQVERIPYKEVLTSLVPVSKGEWIIKDGWVLTDNISFTEANLSSSSNTNKYNAVVPGTVLTTLVKNGVYPDPYYGLNNMSIPESLSKVDWWYSIPLDMPISIEGKEVFLLFNGINYRSEVFLNGKLIGRTEGAFERGHFNITESVKKENNLLKVHVYPPSNPGIPHEQTMLEGQGLNGGMLSLDGPTFISSIGWDWVPGIRDRNTGIWQDVRLQIGGAVRIGDPLVVTDLPLPDTTQASIRIEVPVYNVSDTKIDGVLTAEIENLKLEISYSIEAKEEKILVFSPENHKELLMENPRLWWPNGYGSPELYDLKLITTIGDGFSDTKSLRFGIKELSYELMVSDAKFAEDAKLPLGTKVFDVPEGKQARVEYNPTERFYSGDASPKEPIFDYEKRVPFTPDNFLPTFASDNKAGLKTLDFNDPVGPFLVLKINGIRIFCRGGNWGMDDAMKRVSRERLEPYFELHQDMNFNMIRNWTGESTEEVFYALCDEYGMLVWNDFWITTDDTVEPLEFQLFMTNARETVRRFRNHPSIALWCPRNEGFAPKGLEHQLSEMIAEEDPTRHYHGQSRFLNMGTSGPWGYFEDPSWYYTERVSGFNTEMGAHAIPTANTLKKFIAPEDRWPINDVWAYHDLHHTTQNFEGFMKAVSAYGDPTSLEDFSAKAQFVCYDSWRAMLEAWNSRMWNDATGLVLWMSHPAWPSMIWQTYTYDYETPGSYFGSKKACEPLHIQMNLPDDKVVIINTTLKDHNGLRVSVKYYNVTGKLLYSQVAPIGKNKNTRYLAKSNSLTACFIPDAPVSEFEGEYMIRLELKDAKGELVSVNDYWRNQKAIEKGRPIFGEVEKANISSRLRVIKGEYFVDLKNTSKFIALAVKLNAKDKESGEFILPAHFQDGYFNMLPGEMKRIKLDMPHRQVGVEIVVSGYNL